MISFVDLTTEPLDFLDRHFETMLANKLSTMPHIPGYKISLETDTTHDFVGFNAVVTSRLIYIPDPTYVPEQDT